MGVIRGLFIVPFYLKYIDNTIYALWLATGNIVVWLTFVDPGISNVLQQRVAYFMGKKDLITLSKVITSGIVLSGLISVIAYLISRVFLFLIPSLILMNVTSENEVILNAFNLVSIGTCIQLFSFSFVAINQGLLYTFYTGLIGVSSNIIAISINIFMLFNGYGLLSIVSMIIVNSILILVGNSIYLFKIMYNEKLKIIFNLEYITNFSKILFYTFFSNITSVVSQNIDLILVARYLSAESVLMLELSRRPIKIFQNFINRPSAAIKPSLSFLWGENEFEKSKDYLYRIINILLILTFYVAGGFVLFNQSLIVLWVGSNNFIGYELNIILVINYLILLSISYNASNFIFAIGEIKKHSIATSIQSISLIALLLILGHYFGLNGVVLAMGISIIISTFWYFPLVLINKIKFTLVQLNYLLYTLSTSILLFFISIFCCKKIIITNWIHLIVSGGIYSVIYLLFQLIINKNFKMEIVNLFNKRV